MIHILLLLVVTVFCDLPSKHEITNVPLYSGDIPFKQYSGYIQVSDTRTLFYWYVESARKPSTDPLIMWLSGGPGCSSLEGMSQENGPFIVNSDGTEVDLNPYSWNNVANVLYLESPAGVGYSFSTNPEEYKTCNDNRTASDIYNFLQVFFKDLYPERQNNDFYVACESYGGHYCPVTSQFIYDKNVGKQGQNINLKGYLIGNGASDRSNDGNSLPKFMNAHMLISDYAYEAGLKACHGDFYKYQDQPQCGQYLTQYDMAIQGVNMYGIYYPCDGGVQTDEFAKRFNEKGFDELVHLRNKRNGENIHPFFARHELKLHRALDYGTEIPCYDTSNIKKYFNMPAVQTALGVDPSKIVHGGWDVCNFEVNMYYDWTFDSMIPFHKELLSNGIRGLLYSGDTDMAVNGLGTRMTATQVVPGLDKTFVEWFVDYKDVGKQVAGFTTGDQNSLFQYRTVRGAGHMVPQWKRQAALEMIESFLFNSTG